ncbi:MAG: DUF2835 domain-containing protein [Colwellia sp.]
MRYYFPLNLTVEEFMPYYEGRVHSIVVNTTAGKTVRFPASHLRQVITGSGIHGFYCLETENNKFISLTKVR